ncbi:hypothetical protein H6P81_005331 [Aristolochia fimbriata]|uniref:Pectinesterase inhibitor domain-containing protein n=1 Tax=Aristolochia fimbriata TaxID=158543 RepID=A0AAV7EXP6_ARIFI|nr:hypothetical protein H6P81_005331 [Aristolochia fimbriata]
MEGSSNYGFLLSLISLHLVVASLIISSGSAARVVVHTRGRSTPTTTTTTTEFIRTSCGATTYPRVCVASLSAYATTIQTSPREMAHAALSVTLAGARTASAAIAKMSTLPAGPKKIITKPREKAAVRDCLEELSDSVDELRRSMGEMGRLSGGGRPAVPNLN